MCCMPVRLHFLCFSVSLILERERERGFEGWTWERDFLPACRTARKCQYRVRPKTYNSRMREGINSGQVHGHCLWYTYYNINFLPTPYEIALRIVAVLCIVMLLEKFILAVDSMLQECHEVNLINWAWTASINLFPPNISWLTSVIKVSHISAQDMEYSNSTSLFSTQWGEFGRMNIYTITSDGPRFSLFWWLTCTLNHL